MEARQAVKGYDAGAMVLHWTIALAIFFQLAIGFSMSRLDLVPDATRFLLFQWHKTVGILVLALTLARIAWRLLNPPPAHGPMPRAERLLAGLVHLLFYGLMLVVPLSGWLLVSVSPTKIPTLLMLSEHLPWPDLPLPSTLDAATVEPKAEAAHTWLAYSFVVLIGLHVAGALKHSLIDRAPSFSRMLPLGRLHHQSAALVAIPVAVAAVVAVLGGGVVAARQSGQDAIQVAPIAAAEAPAGDGSGWIIDRPASKLGYGVTFSGKTVSGTAERWTADIVFDPDDLGRSSARVAIDAASITIDDAFVRSNLAGPDGLDAGAFPTIDVALARFERTAAGFVGKGTLRIKTVEAPIEVPFTFARDADGAATVAGSAVFDRLAFGLGVRNDGDGKWLGPAVTVDFSLRAEPPSGPAG